MAKGSESTDVVDVVMIGAGPASLTASIYTTREDIQTVLYERGVIGGLVAITDTVENYPGFPDGITGLELTDKMRAQAEKFGAKIELCEVTGIYKEGELIKLMTTDGEKLAKAVLIAAGSNYKKLNIPGEKEYYARGVHYCATCDGAFYRDKKLVVVGGGNSAVQEALFLTRFAGHIDLLVRSTLRASEFLVHKLENNNKITVHIGTTTDEILGNEGFVNKVIGTEVKSGKRTEFETDGVFIFVGLAPNSQFLVNSDITLDDQGFVVTDVNLKTNIDGIYAAGDIRSGATMQIASVVGDGATAAINIREYLAHK